MPICSIQLPGGRGNPRAAPFQDRGHGNSTDRITMTFFLRAQVAAETARAFDLRSLRTADLLTPGITTPTVQRQP